MKKYYTYIFFLQFLLNVCNINICAQNLKLLHYNIFALENSDNIKYKKNEIVKNFIKNINADIYSFCENTNKKNLLDKSTILKSINQSQLKYEYIWTSSFNHFLVYDSYKISIVEVKNIHTKRNPILQYKLSYQILNNKDKKLSFFIVHPDNAGDKLIECFNKISNYIFSKKIDDYKIILGGTDNIQIGDKRILENTKIDNHDIVRIFEISKNYSLTNQNPSSSIKPNFDMAFHVENINSINKDFQFIPNSFILISKNSNSFYVNLNESFIDSMNAISAHIPIYFELEQKQQTITKEKLSYSELVTADLTLTLNWQKEEEIFIQVNSILGNTIYQTKIICPPSEYEVEIPMSNFAPGFYILKLITSDQEIRKRIQKYRLEKKIYI